MNGKSGIKAPSKKSDSSRKIPSRAGSEAAISRSSSVSTLASVLEESQDGFKASDFAIGERVWVNGNKPGYVQFLGETQFSPGVWAGVKLDAAEGKNDGSVAGVRYFDCEPSKGIFIKPHRLTKQAGSPPSASTDERPQSRLGLQGKLPLASTPPRPPAKIRSGDRVVVNSASGAKTGILRYLGTTDFATGDWAGIELDEPVGKNDGSVGGKKYFECTMKHGLFAPIHKVSKPGMRPTFSGGSLQNRSCSRESLNSACSSIASSRACSRVKLGKSSLSSQKPVKVSSATSPSQSALEAVLKEKEEHIEQLLKELEFQRSEIVQSTKETDKALKSSSKLEEEHYVILQEYKTKVSHLENELQRVEAAAKHASNSWEDEKRKIEDLQFQLEEETILKGELEAQTSKANQKIQELEQLLKATDKNEEFTRQLTVMDASLNAKNEEFNKLNDELRCRQDEMRVKNSEIERLKSSLDSSNQEIKRLAGGTEEATILKEKISALEESHRALEVDHNNMLSEMKTLKEVETAKGLKLTEKQKETEVLQEDLLRKTNELTQTKNSLETERTHNAQAISSLEKLHKEKIAEMTQELNKLNSELSTRDSHFQETQGKLESSKKLFTEKDNQLVQLKTLADNLEAKLRDEVSRNEDLQKKLSLLETKYDETKVDSNEIAIMREKLKNLTSELSERETSNNNLQLQLTTLANEMNNKNNLICELKQQVDETKKEMSLLNQDKSEAAGYLQKLLAEQKEKHETAQHEFQASFSEFTVKNEKLSQLLVERDNQLSQNSVALASIQDALSQKDTEMAKLNVELKNSMEKMESLEKSLRDQTDYMETQRGTFVAEKDQEVASLKSEILKYAAMMESKSKESQAKQNEVSQLLEELKVKEDQLSELGSMVENSQKQLELVKQQNEKNVATMESQVENFRIQQQKHLEGKEKVLQAEIDSLTKQLAEKKSIIEADHLKITQNQSQLGEKDGIIEELKQKLSQFESKLSESSQKEAIIFSELEKKVQMLTSQCEKLKKENTEQEKSTQKAHEELEKTKGLLMKDKMEHQALVQDKELRLETVQQEVERMRREFLKHKDELQQKLDVSQMELEALKEFKAEMEMQHGVLEELQEQLQDSEIERDKLQKQLSEQSVILSEKTQLDEKVVKLQQEIFISSNNATMVTEKNQQLQDDLNKLQNLLKSKEKEIEVLKDVNISDDSNSKLKALEKENLKLQSEVSNLKSTVHKTDSKTQVTKDSDSDDEKESLLSQIDFLNSIIVDLQKKNDELRLVNENSNEEIDVNLNGKRQLPPRLYCDICGLFDLHDTEDCPTQSSFVEDVPHSHHQGKRGEDRPYCNNCEVFGHWTLECDEQETF